MPSKVYTSPDFEGNQLKNAAIHNLANAPSSPSVGQVFLNTTDGNFYGWNGAVWVSMNGGQYVFTQNSPLSTWHINHNLSRYPNVTVADTSGKEVVADVTYVDANNITVSFSV